ncbi:GNAT family N-acetyltransferase [Streptomyces exfoliatus]|uniref:GNAT family N-acetyltransferase n=1 Tax=Streptomyces exfoliatus TaxID=1905 RepID=UPI003C30C4CE
MHGHAAAGSWLRPAASAHHEAAGQLLHIRSATTSDTTPVEELHARCSPRSLYQRYLAPIPRLSARTLQQLLDPCSTSTLLAQNPQGDTVAMATLARSTGDDEAHLAVLVEDTWQHRGLGTALTGRLVHQARTQGLRALHADVLAGNRPMLNILRANGAVAHTIEYGTTSLTLRLTP